MGCYKCKDFKWYDPQPVTYIDKSTGHGYCIFHAPSAEKNISVAEFNKLVSNRVHAYLRSPDKNESCDFSGTIFPGTIDFSSPQFTFLPQNLSFVSATFEGGANFSRTTFDGIMTFDKALFNSYAHFVDTKFHERASFYDTVFIGLSDFSGASFNSEANFFRAQLNESFFEHTVFSWEAIFCCSVLNDVEFNDVHAKGPMAFEKCKVKNGGVRFIKLDLYWYNFIHVPLDHVDFIDCCWPIENGRYKVETENSPIYAHTTRDFYQSMKRKYKDEHNEYEASRWHIAEKEAQLGLLDKETVPIKRMLINGWNEQRLPPLDMLSDRFLYHLLKLYRLISGFGENPFIALLWLLFFIILPAIPFVFPGDMRCYIPLIKVDPLSKQWSITHLWMTLWQLIITIQAALFGFAVRNRFRR